MGDALGVTDVRLARPRKSLSQLNIRNVLLGHLVPAVLQSQQAVAVRCVFDFDNRGEAVEQLAARRRQLEVALLKSPEVSLLISAITGLDVSKAKKKKSGENPSSQTKSSDEQEEENEPGEEEVVTGGKVQPAVTFWIACRVPECMTATMRLKFLNLFQSCGFSVFSCKAVVGRNVKNVEDGVAKALLLVLKDFNWPYAKSLTKDSTEWFLRKSIPGGEDIHFTSFDPAFGDKVVRVTIPENATPSLANQVRITFRELAHLGMEYDLVDQGPKAECSSDSSTTITAVSVKSSLVKAIDLFQFSMNENDCRYRYGYVYRFEKKSTFTYTRGLTVRDYLGEISKKKEFWDIITNQLNSVVSFFDANPNYQGIPQLAIDNNVMEVLDGWFFEIEEKRFRQNVFRESDKGLITPRKFHKYKYIPGKVPIPKDYIASIRNSFPSDGEYTLVIQMLYQLLLAQKWPFKCKKMLMHGPRDSGKTTWLVPLLACMEKKNVARVTNEGKFACHMIKPDTELIWMEEWDPKSLQVDEAKQVLQGGDLVIPRKHNEAQFLEFNSGVYITCNKEPSWGVGADSEAMESRLAKFKCSSIKTLKRGMEVVYNRRAMAIIHYMAHHLRNLDLFQNPLNDNPNYTEWKEKAIMFEDLNSEDVDSDASLDLEVEDVGNVDASILPRAMVEKAHLEIMDNDRGADLIPYRLFTYHQNTEQYHRSVYLGLVGRSAKNIDLSTYDLELLFTVRRRNNWRGQDSLYDAWLLSNFTETIPPFDCNVFTQRYPNWKEERVPMNLMPPVIPTQESNADEESDFFSEFNSSSATEKETTTSPTPMGSKEIKEESEDVHPLHGRRFKPKVDLSRDEVIVLSDWEEEPVPRNATPVGITMQESDGDEDGDVSIDLQSGQCEGKRKGKENKRKATSPTTMGVKKIREESDDVLVLRGLRFKPNVIMSPNKVIDLTGDGEGSNIEKRHVEPQSNHPRKGVSLDVDAPGCSLWNRDSYMLRKY